MKRYIKFDIEQFMRDSRSWKGKIIDLENELRSITEIGGGGGEVHTGGGISNPTQTTALKKQEIVDKIQNIRKYQEAWEYAWNRITDYDQEMIIGFFYTPGRVYDFVRQWCEENASNVRYCYRDRNAALDHFRKHIETWIRSKENDV